MSKPLRVLIIEDSEFDTQLLLSLLKKGGYDPTYERVETDEELRLALANREWDIVLADYNLPSFSAPAALEILKKSSIDLPFIIVSGGIGESTAVDAMKSGAHDYLMKGNLARLVPAVEREIREAANREGRRRTSVALEESELRYRLLWETATDAVILIDTNSTIHFANPAVMQVFGYNPEELIGQNLAFLQPEALRGQHDEGISRYLRTGAKEVNWRGFETVGLRKDGREIPVEVAFSDMVLNDRRWFVGFIRDITERKKAEAELLETKEQFRVAREIQQHLFPKRPPELGCYDIAGSSFPAEATGGDYFDYLPMLNDNWGIVVGDVTGHGIGPALLMAETRAYLRILAKNRHDPGEILTQANMVLAEDVGYERFITLLFARINAGSRSLAYANAGHPPALVLDNQGHIKARLKRTSVPLGIRPNTSYNTSTEIYLNPGDLIAFLTDGYEEATSPEEEFFGIDRIVEILHAQRHQSAAGILKELYKAVLEFTGTDSQLDDLTCVIIKVI